MGLALRNSSGRPIVSLMCCGIGFVINLSHKAAARLLYYQMLIIAYLPLLVLLFGSISVGVKDLSKAIQDS